MYPAGNKRFHNLVYSNNGFSLIELLVVLMISSITLVALTATLPNITNRSNTSLVATQLAAAMKKTRMRAISRVRISTLLIEPDSRFYRIDKTAITKLSPGVLIQSNVSPIRIQFYPDGAADSVDIYLTDEESDGRSPVLIQTNPMTGSISIQ